MWTSESSVCSSNQRSALESDSALRKLVVDLLGHAYGQHLAALEADVDTSRGVSHQ